MKKLIHYLLIVCCVLFCFAFVSCKENKEKDENNDGSVVSITVAGTFSLQTYYPVTNGYVYTIEWELYTNGEIKMTVCSYDNVLGARKETSWGSYYCGYNGSSYAIAYSFDGSSDPSVALYYGTYIQTGLGNMELAGPNSRGEFEGIVAKVDYLVQSDAYGCVILGTQSQYVVKGEDAASVTARAYEAYEFIGWSDGVQTATRTDVNVQENISVQALFQKVSEFYFLDYYAADGGSIQGETRQTVLAGKAGSTVVAIPQDGYEFTGWSDGVQTATRTDVNVQADVSVTANFQPIKNKFTFMYVVDGDGGSIQGETEQTIVEGAYGSTVTAVPDEGYRFVGWYEVSGQWALFVTDQASITSYADGGNDFVVYCAYFELIE